ncbi:MAG: MBL fold metallo-hydrolase [Proteobacteria bacterium]|nr:MBL fold metallo-hydrolase [Pseudomonadota bacterium]
MPVQIPFDREFDATYGEIETVSPMIRRVLSPNPSAFTFKGTGTYIIGHGNVAVIDPGPLLDEHVDALNRALDSETVTHILITHTHNDHSPAAQPLKERAGAPTYAYGPHGSGKFEQGIVVEEGGDLDFVPDVEVRDGDIIEGDGWSVECVYTPGHTSNHICYQLREEKALFPGDHVMGWSTTIVSPPDGDMAQYMASVRRLLDRDDEIYWPTHGAPITDPRPFLEALLAHREEREQQVLDCVGRGIGLIADMVPAMYIDLDPRLIPAAGRSVFSHVIKLVEEGRIASDVELAIDARYELL